METSHLADSGVDTVSDRELGFDFLSKQSFTDEFTDQSFSSNDRSAEDGFLTPTSIDRKIKMIETCPPAPRKPPPPPPSRKRKALFPLDQSSMVADLAAEIAKFSPKKRAGRVLLTKPATSVM